eukprot:TRINITY_DN5395_c0_g1_i5.p1 TRINITY_DN5395_c0_g1~~TRINITY_DN5395_c0_g1_i5.p1  ORF type:complete len:672 (+),score=187.68 TRINITY_DN5395_c0_g1_i5:118-2133(+)
MQRTCALFRPALRNLNLTKRTNLSDGVIQNNNGRLFASGPNPSNNQRISFEPYGRRLNVWAGLGAGAALVALVFWATDQYFHPPTKREKDRQRVVILGSGWGGLSCATELDPNRFEIVLISPRNYFLYTPLLSAFALGKVDMGNIIEPIRTLFQNNETEINFYEATATSIDPIGKSVRCKTVDGGFMDVRYDKLIISVGGVPNTHGVKGVTEYCHFLRQLDDAKKIKNKILTCFESANLPGKTVAEQQKLLNFVVVGGHTASVEFVNELYGMTRELKSQFPNLADKVKVTFVNMDQQNYKNIYDAKVTKYLRERKIEPIKNKIDEKMVSISSIEKDHIVITETKERIPYGICVWIRDNTAAPIVGDLQAKSPKNQKNKNALITDEFLKVKGFHDIYAIGECGTVDQSRIVSKYMQIFNELDENKDGTVDEREFKALMRNYRRKYPQLVEYMQRTHELFLEADVNKDGKLSADEFKAILNKVDASITSLPSTAQVAQQEGRYLGQSLNHTLKESEVRALFHELDVDHNLTLDEKEIRRGLRRLQLPHTKTAVQQFIVSSDVNADGKVNEEEFVRFVLVTQQQISAGDWKKLSHAKILPFRYKHLGGFEYVGYEANITERGSKGKSILDGFGAWWLWNSVYFTNLWTNWNRLQTASNVSQTKLEGRDLSKIDV